MESFILIQKIITYWKTHNISWIKSTTTYWKLWIVITSGIFKVASFEDHPLGKWSIPFPPDYQRLRIYIKMLKIFLLFPPLKSPQIGFRLQWLTFSLLSRLFFWSFILWVLFFLVESLLQITNSLISLLASLSIYFFSKKW